MPKSPNPKVPMSSNPKVPMSSNPKVPMSSNLLTVRMYVSHVLLNQEI